MRGGVLAQANQKPKGSLNSLTEVVEACELLMGECDRYPVVDFAKQFPPETAARDLTG